MQFVKMKLNLLAGIFQESILAHELYIHIGGSGDRKKQANYA